jgi:hypothetical protein
MSDTSGMRVYSPFAPLLLIGCAVLGWMGFQTHQLMSERSNLDAARTNQAQPLEQSRKLRAALDSIAASTQRLADSGDPNAKQLVDELKKRGITINPSAPSTNPPK